jgi:hypothetical protein
MSRAPHSLKKRERRDSLSVGGRNQGGKSSQSLASMSAAQANSVAAEAHFGFAPVAFVDDVVNACNDYAYDGVDYVERKLRAPGALPRGAEREIGTGADAVLEAFQRALDLNLDRFELYSLQNLFVLPDASVAVRSRTDRHGVDDDDDDDDNDADDNNNDVHDTRSNVGVAADDDNSIATDATLDAELESLLASAEELHGANALLREALQQTQTDIGALQPLLAACRPLTSGDQPQVVLDGLMKQVEKLRLQYIQTKALFDASPAAATAETATTTTTAATTATQ